MRRRLTRAALVLLSASLALPAAQAAPARQRGGTCVSGNCANGDGSVRFGYATYTGPWVKSDFTAGTYSVVYAAYPDQTFELTVDAAGYPVKGTVPRGSKDDVLRDPSLYTGSFAKTWNPFGRGHVARYAQGRYTDARGVVHEGEFDFVPGIVGVGNVSGGYYIFQGARIDEDADEVTTGLYISDWTTHDVRAGEYPSYLPIVFHRARPDYIAKLQDDLRAELQRVNAEEAAKLASERESRENWNTLFSTALGVAAVVGVAKVASRSSGSYGGTGTVNALGDTLAGKQSAPAANQKMVGELRERAKTDPALAKRIGKSSDAELTAMLQQAGRTAPPKMTVAEYRAAAEPQATAKAGREASDAKDKQAKDKQAKERQAQEQQAREKQAQEKLAQEKLAQEKQAKEKEKAELAAADRARKKAEAEAARKAEQDAEEQARRDYLVALARGTQLKARTCPGGEGQYYVVGLLPKIRPEKVDCVDLHYRARCEGQATTIDGVGKTFLGIATDCFMGDTYKIEPKPACPLAQLQVTVKEIRACGR